MTADQVLIWRQPIPDKDRATIGQTRHPGHTTTILARGTYDEMLERWDIADKRLRALGLPGHVAVRSIDDPTAITEVSYLTPWSAKPVPKRLAVSGGTPAKGEQAWRLRKGEPDPVAARLAILPGDRVRVRIYGNHYGGIVRKAAKKGCDVYFEAHTRKGGWGGEPPGRVRRFDIWDSYGRCVTEVRTR